MHYVSSFVAEEKTLALHSSIWTKVRQPSFLILKGGADIERLSVYSCGDFVPQGSLTVHSIQGTSTSTHCQCPKTPYPLPPRGIVVMGIGRYLRGDHQSNPHPQCASTNEAPSIHDRDDLQTKFPNLQAPAYMAKRNFKAKLTDLQAAVYTAESYAGAATGKSTLVIWTSVWWRVRFAWLICRK